MVIANFDLSKPFGAKSAWRFVARQGPSITDPIMGDPAPGAVRLCLSKSNALQCDAPLDAKPPAPWADAWEPHYLNGAQVVFPNGKASAPLLLMQTASLHSGDGDQAVYTQAFAYRPMSDRFERIYGHVTGHNNNQDVRLVASGPLAGSVISAEPTDNAPYAFWITVSRLTPDYAYKQVLRYRSATRYGDNNPLSVIDSEMPNIEQRLGLWRPGSPLPLPARCPKPRLVHMELWCN